MITGVRSWVSGLLALAAAEESLNTALKLKPDYADSHVLAGHLYFIKHDLARSRAALERAEAIGTADPWLNLNWAVLLNKEGKVTESSERYKRTIASKTPNSRAMRAAYQGLVSNLLATSNFTEVEATYQQLLAYDPTDAWSRGNYASFLLCSTDDPDRAIPEYRKALEIMDYGMARGGLAAALYRKWAGEKMLPSAQPEAPSAEYAEAQSLVEGTPIQVAIAYCCQGPVIDVIANFDPMPVSETQNCSAR